MSRLRKWLAATDAAVAIAERGSLRYLHIGGEAIQSAMRVDAPDELELHYTQAMMAFLLFQPQPARVTMVGLGGGSIAKFILRRMPETRLKVVEISARVVDVARRYFSLPPDSDRFSVIVEDGARLIAREPQSCEVLLLDAFDDLEQISELCSQSFYDSARDALAPGGVLVANFMAEDRCYDAYLRRIEKSFHGRSLQLAAADRVNAIVLAFRDVPARVSWEELRRRARDQKARFGLPFERFLSSLRAMNSQTAKYLLIAADAASKA